MDWKVFEQLIPWFLTIGGLLFAGLQHPLANR
jgi:hypothetical protein